MIRSVVLDTVVQTGGAFSIPMAGTLVLPSFATTCVIELTVKFVKLVTLQPAAVWRSFQDKSNSCSLSSLEMFRTILILPVQLGTMILCLTQQSCRILLQTRPGVTVE